MSHTVSGVIVSSGTEERFETSSTCNRLVVTSLAPTQEGQSRNRQTTCHDCCKSNKHRVQCTLEPQRTTLRVSGAKACWLSAVCCVPQCVYIVWQKESSMNEVRSNSPEKQKYIVPPSVVVCCVARELLSHLPAPTPTASSTEDTTHSHHRSSKYTARILPVVPRCQGTDFWSAFVESGVPHEFGACLCGDGHSERSDTTSRQFSWGGIANTHGPW